MATRFSVASGDWSSTAVWSGTQGGAPGASAPVSGDYVLIESAVDVSTEVGVSQLYVEDIGRLNIKATGTIVVDDSVPSHITFRPGCTVTSASGARIRSKNSRPVNPFPLRINTGQAAPAIYIDSLVITGNAPTICSGYTVLQSFNLPASTYRLNHITPKSRTPVLDYHRIAGRPAGGRTYARGNDSARLTASGFVTDSAAARAFLESFKDWWPVSLSGWNTHMVRGYIEDVRFRQQPGSQYLYYDIHLVEDR